MKEAVVILSLFGCDDVGQSCEFIPTTSAVFASEAACMRKSEQLFEAHSAANFPVVLAKCDSKAPTSLDIRPNEIVSFDGDVAEHQTVSLDFASKSSEQTGWLKLLVEKPASAVVLRGANVAIWIRSKAHTAANAVNPF